MRRIAITVCLIALALAAVVRLRADDKKANVLLEAGLAKETIQGDLPGAIAQYEKAVKEAGANRALAAKALMQMAECYRKLGDSQAGKIYERIVRDYADQTEAAMAARAKLGGNAETESTRVQRRISVSSGSGFDKVSPDGRLLALGNVTGDLVVHDLFTGREQNITHEGSLHPGAGSGNNYADMPVFTPDSRQIVYQWNIDGGRKVEIRVVNIDGTSKRTVLNDAEYKYEYTEPGAVSPDGKFISAGLWFGDKPANKTAQIALVSLDTGKVRVLRQDPRANPYIGNFSPDGKWLVYAAARSTGPNSAGSPNGEIDVVATDGSSTLTLVPGPVQLADPMFSPDGSRVLFMVSRAPTTQITELWSVGVANGKRLDEPRLERQSAERGRMDLMGFTSQGTLYLSEEAATTDIFVADLDPAALKMTAGPKVVSNRLRSTSPSNPWWSPDGKLLAFLPDPVPAGITDAPIIKVAIRDMASGEEHEISYKGGLRGWLGNKSILSNVMAGGQPVTLKAVDVSDSRDRVLFDETFIRPSGSSDGRFVFHATFDSKTQAPGTFRVLRRDLATGHDQELCSMEAKGGEIGNGKDFLPPSPNDQWLAFFLTRPDEQSPSVWVVSTSGGTPREIQFPKERRGPVLSWTPDSKGLLFIEHPSLTELWAQPLDGGPAHATGVAMRGINAVSSSADGRHIAFVGSGYDNQGGQNGVWAIDNLFAKVGTAKK